MSVFRKPLVWVFCATITLGSLSASAQDFVRNGNKVTYNGNTFLLSAPQAAATSMTGKTGRQAAVPVEMNGKKIVAATQVTTKATIAGASLEKYISEKLNDGLRSASWPDGTYRIDLRSVITDEQGKVVYYEYEGISRREPGGTWTNVSDHPLASSIKKLLTDVRMQPAKVSGKPVIAFSDVFMDNYDLTVKNHAVSAFALNTARASAHK